METNGHNEGQSEPEGFPKMNGQSNEQQIAYSLQQLAPLLGGVSVAFLRLEIARGKLKPRRLGRRVIITADEVARYLEHARSPQRDAGGR
jgi:hypothetical protein